MVGTYELGNSFAPTKRVNERQCCAVRSAPVVGIHRWAIHPYGTKIRHLDHHAQALAEGSEADLGTHNQGTIAIVSRKNPIPG